MRLRLPSLEVNELHADIQKLLARKANEDDLKTTLHHFFKITGHAFPSDTLVLGEQSTEMGRPDIQVNLKGKLLGFVELKKPGKGSDPTTFKGHDLAQWEKFKRFKNIIYTDGVSWRLFQNNRLIDKFIISQNFEDDLTRLLDTFWNTNPVPFVGIDEYSKNLASIRQQLDFYLSSSRNEVAYKEIESLFVSTFFSIRSEPFSSIFSDFLITALASIKIIFKNDVDVYADYKKIKLSKYQTDFLKKIFSEHSKGYLAYPLSIISGHINDLDVNTYKSTSNGLKLFFECYLRNSRPSDKKQDGVFYTPEYLSNFHVRLAYAASINQGLKLDKLRIIDPAAGTGTYTLALISEYFKNYSVKDKVILKNSVGKILENIISFEINEGAALVAANKINAYLQTEFHNNKEINLNYFITDTLSNRLQSRKAGKFNEYIKNFQKTIESYKKLDSVNLIIGNPPFHLHKDLSPTENKKISSKIGVPDSISQIFDYYAKRLAEMGYPRDNKFLWDSAVFFLIWSLQRAEISYKKNKQPCIVSLILPRTIISSKFAAPIRERILQSATEITVIDLGGEHRGAQSEFNIFEILKAVCILTFSISGKPDNFIRYKKLHEKDALNFEELLNNRSESISSLKITPTLKYNYSFIPDTDSNYADFIDLREVVELTLNGIQLKRLWPVGITKTTLENRWRALITSSVKDRSSLYVENSSQKISKIKLSNGKKITELDLSDECPKIVRLGYRSFDYQWLILDKGLAYTFRGDTYLKHSKGQGYFVGHLTKPSSGDCFLTFSDAIVETDFHAKRGARDVMPLFIPGTKKVNIKEDFIKLFYSANKYEPVDFMFYAIAVLSSKIYCEKYSNDTEKYGLRVPYVIDKINFEKLVQLGKEIATINNLGNSQWGVNSFNSISQKNATLESNNLTFKLILKNKIDIENGVISGEGWSIKNISSDVFKYQLSGYYPVRSVATYWSSNRVKKRSKLDSYFPQRFSISELSPLLNTIHAVENMINIQKKLNPLILSII